MKLLKLNFNANFNQIAQKLQKGDQRAGEEIFKYFSPKFYHFFIVRTLSRETAEDLTQDVFLKIVNKIGKYDPNKGNFNSWAWQIARNTAKDYYHQAEHRDIPVAEFIEKYSSADEKKIIDNYKIQEILAMAKKLNPDEQELFSLHYVSDLSYKEISQMTGKSEGTLRVLIHRINQKLRQQYYVA